MVFHVTGLMPMRGASPNHDRIDRHRSSEDIIYAILSIAQNKEGATKMQIMAGAFISYETATGYLEKLAREGLIEYNSGKGVYTITDKGRQRMIEYGNV